MSIFPAAKKRAEQATRAKELAIYQDMEEISNKIGRLAKRGLYKASVKKEEVPSEAHMQALIDSGYYIQDGRAHYVIWWHPDQEPGSGDKPPVEEEGSANKI